MTDITQIFIFILAFFGIFLGLSIVLVYVVNHTSRNRKDENQTINNNVKEKETIIREVVMIPCQYCGALTPQTATFCPNCGAARKTNI